MDKNLSNDPRDIVRKYNEEMLRLYRENKQKDISQTETKETTEPEKNEEMSIEDKYPEPVLPSYIAPAVSSSSLPVSMQDSKGWLSAKVAAADNTIPVNDALVLITDSQKNLKAILTTNEDGITRTVALAAPPKALSESPETQTKPFYNYNMNVYKQGYYEVENIDISVFPDTVSIQPVNMVPLPFAEGYRTITFDQPEPEV